MKIAVISHAHFPIAQPFAGGLEAHTDLLVKQLIDRGHDVTLYAKAGSQTDATLVSIFRGNALSGKNKLLRVAYRFACAHAQLQNYDLIFNNSLNNHPLKWHDESMPPMITIFHTPPFHELYRTLQQQPSYGNRTYIAVSQLTADQWQPYVNDQIQIMPNGIDTDCWQTCLEAPQQTTAIWTGRITPEKGTHIAIQAARIAGIPLTICGGIYDKKYYTRQIKPLIDGNFITYRGHVNQQEINLLYGKSSVALVTPLWDEPFGFVTVEALSSGTPVAALPNGATPSIVTSEVGELSISNTAEDLAVAMKAALTKDRATCSQYARNNFDANVMVDNYLSVVPEQQYADESLQWQM